MATLTELEELKEKYQYSTSVNFEGNEDIEAFYGQIVDFKLDTDNSIIVTLRDMEDDCFDISWDEVKNLEFDFFDE